VDAGSAFHSQNGRETNGLAIPVAKPKEWRYDPQQRHIVRHLWPVHFRKHASLNGGPMSLLNTGSTSFLPSRFLKQQVLTIAIAASLTIGIFAVWPILPIELLSTNYLPMRFAI